MSKRKMVWKLQENILDSTNKRELVKFIRSTDRYTQFEKVKEFEKEWSKWQGCKYSVFVNSGSSANLVLLDILREIRHWKAGDEIIVPAVTWITDISSVIQLGLKPVFVDVNLEDFSFDYEHLAKKITRKTKAIFVTHLIGFPADVARIKKIVGRRKIAIIEDCCESHGAQLSNYKKVGNMALVSSFSFYWGHHMTSIEGGMVCTNDKKIYKYALLKRSHGLARELPKQYHQYYKSRHKTIDFNFLFLTTGFNVRNTELHAVLGISQLKNLDTYIHIRNRNHDNFIKLLKKYDKYFYVPNHPRISSFCLPFLLKNGIHKKQLQRFLTRRGIESRPIISGNLLKQPFLKKFIQSDVYPNANFIHDNCFYVGNNQFVGAKHLQFLDSLLSEYFSKYIRQSKILTPSPLPIVKIV